MTHIFKNRDEINICFTRVDRFTVAMTNYYTLKVTGTDDNILAVDPNGGPTIAIGNDIGKYVTPGQPVKYPVKTITINEYAVLFTVTIEL